MLEELTQKLTDLVPLMAPDLIGTEEPDIEMNEDCSILEYSLTDLHDSADIMDILEDDMDLSILYHCRKKDSSDARQHICAISDPSGDYMLKVNIITNPEGQIDHITITLFTSMDTMLDSIQGDIVLHEEKDYEFITMMDEGILAAMFAIV